MKKLASNISISLFNQTYVCNLYLGLYAASGKPALILDLAESGEPFAKATCNPPLGFLIGFPRETFCWKDWGENEGLQAQLEELLSEDGTPLFQPLLRRDKTRMAITLGHAKSELSTLSGVAFEAFEDLRKTFHESGASASACTSHTPIL